MKETEKKFSCSIVIPAYQSEKYIAACLSSVQTQTAKNIEIIVVDDGSTDQTAMIVNDMATRDTRICYYRQEENCGVAAARNRGVREAQGEWIAFLDCDDLWLPGKLEAQFSLQRESDAHFLYTAAQCIDEKGELTGKRFHVPERMDYATLLKGNDIVCSSVLVLRTLLLRYPMERSDLHEDYITWLRMLKDGDCTAAGVAEPMVLYRISKGSKSGNKWKAARMTWASYRFVGVPFLRRCWSFMFYTLHGIGRYWG